MAKLRYHSRAKSSIGKIQKRSPKKCKILAGINRSRVASVLCLYRKRYRVLSLAGVDVSLGDNTKVTEEKQIANNELIDRTLEAAGLGDKRVDRWEKLQ